MGGNVLAVFCAGLQANKYGHLQGAARRPNSDAPSRRCHAIVHRNTDFWRVVSATGDLAR